MTKENNQNNLKQIIDNLLLINLFLVIFFCNIFYFCNHHAIERDIYFYKFYSDSLESSYCPINNNSYYWCFSKWY